MQTALELKTLPIQKAVRETFEQMPKTFSAFNLCMETRRKLSKQTMDGTILRRLRELREKGVCPYTVKDSQKSIYQKA